MIYNMDDVTKIKFYISCDCDKSKYFELSLWARLEKEDKRVGKQVR